MFAQMIFFCVVNVMYSGEYDVCDVTQSVYPHRASLKSMPATVGIEPTTFGILAQKHTLKTRLHVFYNKLSWPLSGKVLLLVFELLHILYCDISWYLATI
jgi:hypothetical protein